jgi:GT2 family glycosyltransferase
VRVVRSEDRVGVPGARNLGARAASSDVLLITDSHVRLGDGWDRRVLAGVGPGRVIAATIADPTSKFRGHGCSLVVPFMGTHWNRDAVTAGTAVHIPSCAGTALTRELFDRIGGYDDGMWLYGGAEPEFGVRAWLTGAEVVADPELIVWHRFKSRAEIETLLVEVRTPMVHNLARFGLLYLSDAAALQVIRLHAGQYPEHVPAAYARLESSDVWRRRAALARSLPHDFAWFVKRFGLRNQAGGEIPLN